MKKLVVVFALIFGSVQAVAQSWTVFEANLGAQFVQGEMVDGFSKFNQPNALFTASIHTRGAKSRRMSYGGSVSAYTMNATYVGEKNWLNGHSTEGLGYNVLASARYLITGRDDMRFMRGAFITYIELGGGAHFASYRSTYPPNYDANKTDIDRPTNTVFAPAISGALGFQYFITQNWGVNLRVNTQYTASDELDGIEGITDVNDYLFASSLGMIYAF